MISLFFRAQNDALATLNARGLKRTAAQIATSGTSAVSGLSYYMFGVFYGEYAGSAYSFPFDVESLGASKHQMFASTSAYCDVKADLTNNAISVTNNHGFSRLVVVLYRYSD